MGSVNSVAYFEAFILFLPQFRSRKQQHIFPNKQNLPVRVVAVAPSLHLIDGKVAHEIIYLSK